MPLFLFLSLPLILNVRRDANIYLKRDRSSEFIFCVEDNLNFNCVPFWILFTASFLFRYFFFSPFLAYRKKSLNMIYHSLNINRILCASLRLPRNNLDFFLFFFLSFFSCLFDIRRTSFSFHFFSFFLTFLTFFFL